MTTKQSFHKQTKLSGESDYSQRCSAHHVKTQVKGDSPSGCFTCSFPLSPFCLGHAMFPRINHKQDGHIIHYISVFNVMIIVREPLSGVGYQLGKIDYAEKEQVSSERSWQRLSGGQSVSGNGSH